MAVSGLWFARKRKSGQVLLEYVLAFIALAAVVAALITFAAAARREARQTAELVTSDYP